MLASKNSTSTQYCSKHATISRLSCWTRRSSHERPHRSQSVLRDRHLMSDKRYNGWTNYETWLVALWADNDEASYHYQQRLAQQFWDDSQADSTFSRDERATLDLAKSLRDETEDA